MTRRPQSVAFSAAVIVTTPQKLAFIDVAKGIRMFAKLMVCGRACVCLCLCVWVAGWAIAGLSMEGQRIVDGALCVAAHTGQEAGISVNARACLGMQVPCVAVVENMSYFEADGKHYFPFGEGSGEAGGAPDRRWRQQTRSGFWSSRTAVRAAPALRLRWLRCRQAAWCSREPARAWSAFLSAFPPEGAAPLGLAPLCLHPSEPTHPYPKSPTHSHPAGERIQREFGLPNLVRFPIVPDLSAAGDSGRPVVVTDPTGPTAQAFLELGAAVVREVGGVGGGWEEGGRACGGGYAAPVTGC